MNCRFYKVTDKQIAAKLVELREKQQQIVKDLAKLRRKLRADPILKGDAVAKDFLGPFLYTDNFAGDASLYFAFPRQVAPPKRIFSALPKLSPPTHKNYRDCRMYRLARKAPETLVQTCKAVCDEYPDKGAFCDAIGLKKNQIVFTGTGMRYAFLAHCPSALDDDVRLVVLDAKATPPKGLKRISDMEWERHVPEWADAVKKGKV